MARKTICILILFTLIFSALPLKASAFSYDWSSDYQPQKIWDFLVDWLDNEYGAAAIMGNLYCESGLNPTNASNWFNSRYGISDEDYTRSVDDGSYTDFVNDGASYGIAQWTYWSRKQSLMEFAAEVDASIGSLEMQLEYLKWELSTGYYDLVNDWLICAENVDAPSEMILRYYERSGDYSAENLEYRASVGRGFYDTFAKGPVTAGDVNDDGIADANDLTVLSRHVAKIELITDRRCLKAADVSGDGSISADDLTLLSRSVAKIE